MAAFAEEVLNLKRDERQTARRSGAECPKRKRNQMLAGGGIRAEQRARPPQNY